jgi:hypothetical protein
MKNYFLVLAFLTLMVGTSNAQSIQTFVYDFGEHKTYLRVGSSNIDKSVSWVTTVKIKDHQCKQIYVSPVKITDNRIVFEGGTVWKVSKAKRGIKIIFPSQETVKYKLTDENPLQYCKRKRGI